MSITILYNINMRVGMDISQIAHGGGVTTYTQELAQKLSNIPSLEMFFFYTSFRKPYRGKLKNVKSYRLPPTLFEVLFNRIRNTNIEKFIGEVDVFHSSDWVQPPSKAKKVTTYHDVIPLKYPQWSHPKIIAVHKRRLKLVEKEIDYVVAVSGSTKRDLMEVSSIPEEKIIVIYEAAGEVFKRQKVTAVDQFRKKMGLPNKFVLAIGGIGERRNLKRIKEACKNYSLIVAGQNVPWQSYEKLPLLYSAATVLLYPSLYEGFGLPILEAFACGTPVITSNVSSMPEVGGEAAEYVNPESVVDIENKLRIVMEDKKKRESMIKKGFSQAKKFSWQKCAEETAEVYKEVINR